MTEHMIQPESPSGWPDRLLTSRNGPATTTPPRLWDLPTVAALGAHTYWRRPELTDILHRSRAPRRWDRVLGTILGALWGASETWAGLLLLSPGRDVAVSFWLPGRWWRHAARMLAFLVVFFLAVLVPSVVLSHLFEVDVVPALAIMGVVVALVSLALAWVDSRAHRGRGPKRVPGMVSITGLASRSGSPWGPSRFFRDEPLPWATNHNVGLYAAAATPGHARLYARLGSVPVPEHGPLARIRRNHKTTTFQSHSQPSTAPGRENGEMSTSHEHRLVLVTGAGASVNFGTGDHPLPLMNSWSDALVAALDRREEAMASTISLTKGLSGEEFEEALGAFLRWTQTLPATKRFLPVGHPLSSEITGWLSRTERRTKSIIEAINESLWQEFGLARVDDSKAADTYRQLFTALDALPGGGTHLFSATTNYDRSGEVALSDVGFTADTGARERPGRTKRLDVDTIEPWGDPSTVPHLHLHGAVGWYRAPGRGIRVQPADEEYDDRRTPAVLYPDPNKDPLGDVEVGVHTLWAKLAEALDSATDVLVLGHSLHDAALLDALARRALQRTRFAFCFHRDPDPIKSALNAHDTFKRHDVNVSMIAMDFQPEHDFVQVEEWINGAHIRKDGTASK